MLISVDNLARINEAYGFDVADEVIALGRAAHPQPHARRRPARPLLRATSSAWCSPPARRTTSMRRRTASSARVREDVVQTAHGPVAATVTIGGVAAPRHARTVARDDRARAGVARRRQGQAAELVRCLPAEYRARRAAQGERAHDRQDRGGAERAAHPARLRAGGRDHDARAGVLRMPDAHPRAPTAHHPGKRGHSGRRAARAGAADRPSRARAGGRRARGRARS